MPIASVFIIFYRLQLSETSVASVFAASRFARFRKWRIYRFLHGFLYFLYLKERTQDMASPDKDNSLICSLYLGKVL